MKFVCQILLVLMIYAFFLLIIKKFCMGNKVFRKHRIIKVVLIIGCYIILRFTFSEKIVGNDFYSYLHTVLFSVVCILTMTVGKVSIKKS